MIRLQESSGMIYGPQANPRPLFVGRRAGLPWERSPGNIPKYSFLKSHLKTWYWRKFNWAEVYNIHIKNHNVRVNKGTKRPSTLLFPEEANVYDHCQHSLYARLKKKYARPAEFTT